MKEKTRNKLGTILLLTIWGAMITIVGVVIYCVIVHG